MIMKNSILLICSLIFLFILSCGLQSDNINIEYQDEYIKVDCNIIKFRNDEIRESTYTFVFAKIEIFNLTDKKIIFNLEKLKLLIDDNLFEKVYLTGIVYYKIKEDVLQPHSSIKKDIYWPIQKVITPDSVNSLKLVYEY